jgi:hypothetical protein
MGWYEVPFPEGNYFALEMGPAQDGWEYQGTGGSQLGLHVPFFDVNEDGIIDFVARTEDGSWTAFTFVEESH